MPPIAQIMPLLHLMRIALALAVVSNCWVTVFLAVYVEPADGRSMVLEQLPLGMALLWAALVALGLHVYGVSLNDVLDARHDRLFSPQRPIPAGHVRRSSAVIIAIIGLLIAMVAGAFLGHEAILLTVLAAGGLLFFNATGKFLPAAGILALALIRMMTMLIPNAHMGFAWPLWMTMTHVAAATALGHLLEDKRPTLDRREILRLAIGWTVGTAVIISFMAWRGTILAYGRPFIWIGPAIAGAIFIAISAAFVIAARRRQVSQTIDHDAQRHSARAYTSLAILWLIVYDAAWLFCAGLLIPGLIHLALFSSVYVILYLNGPLRRLIGLRPRYRITIEPDHQK